MSKKKNVQGRIRQFVQTTVTVPGQKDVVARQKTVKDAAEKPREKENDKKVDGQTTKQSPVKPDKKTKNQRSTTVKSQKKKNNQANVTPASETTKGVQTDESSFLENNDAESYAGPPQNSRLPFAVAGTGVYVPVVSEILWSAVPALDPYNSLRYGSNAFSSMTSAVNISNLEEWSSSGKEETEEMNSMPTSSIVSTTQMMNFEVPTTKLLESLGKCEWNIHPAKYPIPFFCPVFTMIEVYGTPVNEYRMQFDPLTEWDVYKSMFHGVTKELGFFKLGYAREVSVRSTNNGTLRINMCFDTKHPDYVLGLLKWYGYTREAMLRNDEFPKYLGDLMKKVLLKKNIRVVLKRAYMRREFSAMFDDRYDAIRSRRAPKHIPEEWGKGIKSEPACSSS